MRRAAHASSGFLPGRTLRASRVRPSASGTHSDGKPGVLETASLDPLSGPPAEHDATFACGRNTGADPLAQ